MAFGAKQWLPSSSKTDGPERRTDWGRDEDGDPADVPVVGHESPLVMCIGVSQLPGENVTQYPTHMFLVFIVQLVLFIDRRCR